MAAGGFNGCWWILIGAGGFLMAALKKRSDPIDVISLSCYSAEGWRS